MPIKKIQQVLPPAPPHMVGDGFRVHNFFPNGYNMDQKRMSPFFLLDYNSPIEFAPTDTPRGVDVHPHRGFETVTIAFKGKIAHHDSTGNSGVIAEGDVQWMTAAAGILHKEYHELEFSKKGGPFQMVQLWVNLPAKHKMSRPKYQAITNEQISRHLLPAGDGYVEVIAGDFKGTAGAASTFTPIELYTIHLTEGAGVAFDLPAHFNTGILIVEGTVTVNGSEEVAADHFVLFQNQGETIQLKAGAAAKVLVLSGEPIDEPIAAYGPFLMNTHEELQQALTDFRQGKFGSLQ